MQRSIRITTAVAAFGTTAASYAHDHPVAHAHGVLENLVIMMLIASAGMLVLVALKQARAAQRKRARQAIPVVIIRPGLRLFRDR